TLMALGGNTRDLDPIWEKQTIFQLYMKIDIKMAYSAWKRRRDSLRRRQNAQTTASEYFETASEVADLKKPLEDSTGRRRHN
ncbi:hypothetical protein Tco_0288892, partial [Tanacetum coccineum]